MQGALPSLSLLYKPHGIGNLVLDYELRFFIGLEIAPVPVLLLILPAYCKGLPSRRNVGKLTPLFVECEWPGTRMSKSGLTDILVWSAPCALTLALAEPSKATRHRNSTKAILECRNSERTLRDYCEHVIVNPAI